MGNEEIKEQVEAQQETPKLSGRDRLRKNRKQKVAANSRFWKYEGVQLRTALPTPGVEQEADTVRALAFRRFLRMTQVEEGEQIQVHPSEAQLIEEAKERGLFASAEQKYGGDLDDVMTDIRTDLIELQAKVETLMPADADLEEAEADVLEEAREHSAKIRQLRTKLSEVNAIRRQYLGGSAESKADEVRDAFVVVKSTYVLDDDYDPEDQATDPTGELLWEDPEEFLAEEDKQLASLAQLELGYLRLGLRTDDTSVLDLQFPENRILRHFNQQEDEEDE